ncbi:MAG: hypothetical protein DRI84_08615 [Bacteroidetes bacterium]|nr:MAG: hypothetical protein DRI84_08615 [Bacteroidota bacterium]
MKKHIDIFIEGNLEKADFNFYSQMGAFKYNINAIYKNGDTRHVEIEAEGEDQNVSGYIEFLQNGALGRHIEIFNTVNGKFKNIHGFTSLKVHKEKFKAIKRLFNAPKRY